MSDIVRIADSDNVAVALRALVGGTTVGELRLTGDIPAGHKIALRTIRAGEPVFKYGYPIGVATHDIGPGEHVHTHNVASALAATVGATARRAEVRTGGHGAPTAAAAEAPRTFDGFRRADGRVGIRNEIWIVNTVGCVTRAAERIAEGARELLAREPSAIEGVHAITQPYGCSQLGQDLDATRRILAGLVRHPNTAGVLVLGLGCESNQLASFLGAVGPLDARRVQAFNAQDFDDEVQEGIARVRLLARAAATDVRQPIGLGELIVGMKCGGSDGLSGITANPLVGRLADRLTAAGGTVLLSEVPEMFGAESVLVARACSDALADQTIALVNGFRDYFRRHGEPIDENPSPGNKDGGITTLAEKSLGCVQKGGMAPVSRVLAYGEAAPAGLGGLALVNAPGNDGVSSTAMVAAGAHLLLFTTGRGTPMGSPAPTIKISTNSELARRKASWIDFDAGPLALGTGSFDELGPRLLSLVLDVASGRVRTRNELAGNRDVSIWKDGVTL